MTNTPLAASIAAAVRTAMAEAGRTQVELAAHLNVKQQTVSDKLRGGSPFSIDQLARTAEFLDVPLAQLLPVGASA